MTTIGFANKPAKQISVVITDLVKNQNLAVSYQTTTKQQTSQTWSAKHRTETNTTQFLSTESDHLFNRRCLLTFEKNPKKKKKKLLLEDGANRGKWDGGQKSKRKVKSIQLMIDLVKWLIGCFMSDDWYIEFLTDYWGIDETTSQDIMIIFWQYDDNMMTIWWWYVDDMMTMKLCPGGGVEKVTWGDIGPASRPCS